MTFIAMETKFFLRHRTKSRAPTFTPGPGIPETVRIALLCPWLRASVRFEELRTGSRERPNTHTHKRRPTALTCGRYSSRLLGIVWLGGPEHTAMGYGTQHEQLVTRLNARRNVRCAVKPSSFLDGLRVSRQTVQRASSLRTGLRTRVRNKGMDASDAGFDHDPNCLVWPFVRRSGHAIPFQDCTGLAGHAGDFQFTLAFFLQMILYYIPYK